MINELQSLRSEKEDLLEQINSLKKNIELRNFFKEGLDKFGQGEEEGDPVQGLVGRI